jgi:tRNA (guanine37-N1)-methyltransferase
MVMQYEPLAAAISAAKQVSAASRVMGMSPQGRQITQGVIREWALGAPIIFVAGRYEGLDERLFTGQIIQEEWSIGDYVLTGGELAIMVILDAMSRWVPGVLGHAESVQRESFVDGLLDCPHYTRPARVAEQEVPEVLLRGDHEAIRCWRRKQQLGRTWVRRSELLNKVVLTEEDRGFLKEFLIEQGENKS